MKPGLYKVKLQLIKIIHNYTVGGNTDSAATVENSTEFPQKAKNGTAF